MTNELNKTKPIVRLRAFRAIDDAKSCELFIDGHTKVLTSIGITKLTSARHEWMYNPAVFVLIVESLDGKNVYGGARINVSGGTQPLPIEEATGILDDKIFDLVKKLRKIQYPDIKKEEELIKKYIFGNVKTIFFDMF